MFIVRNEGFECENCGTINPPADKTCRDHCIKCLFSKHVDVEPGDRANTCQGLMRPMGVTLKGGYWDKIQYTCTKCHQSHQNKVADDDDRGSLMKILSQEN